MTKGTAATLKQLIFRYKTDTEMLSKHPENRELLERRIREHEKAIIEYVTSDSFQFQLVYLSL